MKKLGLLLLLPACLQQGLVADPDAVSQDTTTTTTTGGGALSAQVVMSKKSSVFLKTIFGNKAYSSSKPIEGYGGGELGESFCFSNENQSDAGTFDSLVDCRRPLASEDLPAREDELLELLTQETGRDDAKGLGLVIHALQFYFSNTLTAPTNNYYSQIDLGSVKLTAKTAPILYDANANEFYWDSAKEQPLAYAGSGMGDCNLSNPDTVGFDIGSDSSLGSKAERSKYFVTGLWVFERAATRPYESSTISPIGTYTQGGSAAGDGPSQLFSTRTNVHSSLIVPTYDSNDEALGAQYFPGANSTPTDAPSLEPSPEKYTFGLYRQSSVPVLGTIDSNNEDSRNSTLSDQEGALVTPVMGKYVNNGGEVNANSVPWQKRVITALCISGKRSLYNGSATAVGTYPLIHALKYELRKIKVVLK